MTTPNWQHNSGKPPKRKLKPQALRSAKERRRQLINRLLKTSSSQKGFYNRYITNKTDGCFQRNKVSVSEVTCY